MRRTLLIPALAALTPLVAVPILTGCGGSSSSASKPTGPVDVGATVVLKSIAFRPAQVTIRSGQAVTWQWDDSGVVHNVVSADFRSGDKSAGTYEHVFRRAGSYDYQCSIHAGMTGTVVVQ